MNNTLRILALVNAALLALIIALLVLVAFNTANRTVIVELSDARMTVNPACAAVIAASGATTAHDVHANVTGTPEYLEACF